MKLTVIGRDNGNQGYENVLIYCVEVLNLAHQTVLDAFIEARESDVTLDEDDKENMEVLFAFEGQLDTVADWRE